MKYFVSIIFSTLFCSLTFAQKFAASIDAQVSVPQMEYAETNPGIGYGLRVNFLYKPGVDIPIQFGIELGMQEKGRTSQRFSGSIYGILDQYRVSATNNIFSLMMLTRFQPTKLGKVKPFIDLTAGWNVFYSTVEVERLTYYSSYNSTYSNSTKAHWALAYGGAAGVDIPLNKRDDVGLELKAAYLIGNHSRYLSDPYISNEGEVSFVERNSRTNMLIPQAGVRITIK